MRPLTPFTERPCPFSVAVPGLCSKTSQTCLTVPTASVPRPVLALHSTVLELPSAEGGHQDPWPSLPLAHGVGTSLSLDPNLRSGEVYDFQWGRQREPFVSGSCKHLPSRVWGPQVTCSPLINILCPSTHLRKPQTRWPNSVSRLLQSLSHVSSPVFS